MGDNFRCHELDLGLPDKIHFHVLLSSSDLRLVEENHQILLDNSRDSYCLLDIHSAEPCHHLFTSRRKFMSASLSVTCDSTGLTSDSKMRR
jgi:hypothetical protein